MQQMQPLFIGPYELGAEKNLTPFMIPEQAFPTLTNAYVWRGRVRRKGGYSLLGRLRRCITSQNLTQMADGATTTISDLFADASLNLRTTEPNAQIEAGSLSIVVGAITFTEPSPPDGTISDGANTGTVDYATGEIVLNFDPALGAPTTITITFCYFPSLPVMGLPNRETDTILGEQTIAFDTKYAYRFVAPTGWEELPSTPSVTWSGTDYDLFWTTNYYRDASNNQIFWATNFNTSTPDPIRYYTSTTPAWTDFQPALGGANRFLVQGKIIIPYKDRLVVLHTYEQVGAITFDTFPQRARWSQNGSPIDTVNGWLDNVVGRGGYIDAPTQELILTAGFVKDELIVYFSNSTWKLVYTGNAVLPFTWQRINSELGSSSTFSAVDFDNGLIAMGTVGIHVCNGVTCARIDEKVPDVPFTVHNGNNGTERVYGIRDFFRELCYFSYPEFDVNPKFPNKVLVYNYRNDTFSFFNESFTAYGYFQRITDYTWATLPYPTWIDWNQPWGSPYMQQGFTYIIAGNQQGFVLQLNQDSGRNEESRYISAMSVSGTGPYDVVLTSPDHNFQVGNYVRIKNALGITALNDLIFLVIAVTSNTLTIQSTTNPTGTYIGLGVIESVDNLNIRTKFFTPFWQLGRNFKLRKISYLLDKTAVGQVAANVYIDTDESTSLNDLAGSGNSGLLGTNIVLTTAEPFLTYTQRMNQVWHHQYPLVDGNCFQVQITLSDAQMRDLSVNNSDVTLHAVLLYFDVGESFE